MKATLITALTVAMLAVAGTIAAVAWWCRATLTPLDWAIAAGLIILVLLPPRYDPAVQIKAWQIKHWGTK